MNDTQRRFLRKLRDAQPGGLRRSSIPKTCADLVQELKVCGAVEFRPSQAGRGIVLCILSQEAFRSFIGARLPSGLDIDNSAIDDRAAAVIVLADAKQVRRAVAEGIIIRSLKPSVQISSVDGRVTISVSQLTVEAGGGCVQLSAERSWAFAGNVAVVENADAFWRYDAVLPNVDLAILGSGNLSRRLLDWLASPAMGQCHVTHWGDYDPVGVYQYLRLADACPGRVKTFAPSEVDELLPKYGKRKLVTRQSRFLDRLRCRTSDPYVSRMVNLFDRHRRGLEQEVLLFDHASVAFTSNHRLRRLIK